MVEVCFNVWIVFDIILIIIFDIINIIILLTKAQKNTPVVDTCLGILKQEHLIEHRPNLPGELVRFNHIVESGFVSDLINLLLKVINNVILFLTKHHCTACLSHREGTT